jgi:hypothetical protein
MFFPTTTSSALHVSNFTRGADSTSNMNAFQWLILLGFPPATAAASVMPELFRSDENVTIEEVSSALTSIAA